MSAFSVLGIGANGMNAQQFGTQVTANNASNVNTPGYSRRITDIRSVPGPPEPGMGARAAGQRRVVDTFLERRILGGRSLASAASSRASALSILDASFGDGPGNIGEAMDALQMSLGDLSSHPNEPAARVDVLSRAEQLAESFNRTAQTLAQTRADLNERIENEVGELAATLEEIADIGREIAQVELTGQEASDLRDRRDELVRKVADIVPVKVIEKDDGQIDLLLAGSVPLVSSDGTAHPLTTTMDPTSGDVSVFVDQAGVSRDVTPLVDSGSVGGLIEARDGALTTAQEDLDQLAFDLANAYNAAHSAGFGLDGVGGRDMFEPPLGVVGAAANLAVSADILDDPDALAAASDPAGMPGDNRNALDMLEVADLDNALGGTATLNESFGAMVATAGSAVQRAMAAEEHTTASLDQLAAMRDSLSGVSVDEEMVSLMRFQRGYQASLRVIQTADEMLGELINMKR